MKMTFGILARLRLLGVVLAFAAVGAATTTTLAASYSHNASTSCIGSHDAQGFAQLYWSNGVFNDWGTTNASIFWWDGSRWTEQLGFGHTDRKPQ